MTRNINADDLGGAPLEQLDILGSAATTDIEGGLAPHLAEHSQLGWPIQPAIEGVFPVTTLLIGGEPCPRRTRPARGFRLFIGHFDNLRLRKPGRTDSTSLRTSDSAIVHESAFPLRHSLLLA